MASAYKPAFLDKNKENAALRSTSVDRQKIKGITSQPSYQSSYRSPLRLLSPVSQNKVSDEVISVKQPLETISSIKDQANIEINEVKWNATKEPSYSRIKSERSNIFTPKPNVCEPILKHQNLQQKYFSSSSQAMARNKKNEQILCDSKSTQPIPKRKWNDSENFCKISESNKNLCNNDEVALKRDISSLESKFIKNNDMIKKLKNSYEKTVEAHQNDFLKFREHLNREIQTFFITNRENILKEKLTQLQENFDQEIDTIQKEINSYKNVVIDTEIAKENENLNEELSKLEKTIQSMSKTSQIQKTINQSYSSNNGPNTKLNISSTSSSFVGSFVSNDSQDLKKKTTELESLHENLKKKICVIQSKIAQLKPEWEAFNQEKMYEIKMEYEMGMRSRMLMDSYDIAIRFAENGSNQLLKELANEATINREKYKEEGKARKQLERLIMKKDDYKVINESFVKENINKIEDQVKEIMEKCQNLRRSNEEKKKDIAKYKGLQYQKAFKDSIITTKK